MRYKIRLIIVIFLMVPALCGCVRRKMTVASNPPGAAVYLDGKEIGRTPFSTNFNHYGKREFRVVKPGYETKTELVRVRAPWYQWIGFDFVSEVLLPGKLTDHKYYEFDLQPARIVPAAEIVEQGEELRRTAHADGVPRIGGSAATSLPTMPSAVVYPQPDSVQPSFAPTSPAETFRAPPSTQNPSTFVPPTVL